MFLNQLFLWWEQTGKICCEASGVAGSAWKLTCQIEQLPVMPPDIGAILDERICLLSQELQDVLERGSVEGEEFTAQLTQTLLRLDEQAIWHDMRTLQNDYRLVHGRGTQRIGSLLLDLYRFEHRFFGEHIYKQLESGQRRSFHRQVGEAMERLYPDHERIAGPMARHFKEGGELFRAASYAVIAARLEHARYSWSTGEYWCQFGLDLVREVDTEQARLLRIDLLQQSGEGFYNKSDFERAADRFSDAAAHAKSAHVDPDRVANLFAWLADAYECQSDYEQAMTAVLSGKEILHAHRRRITEALLGLLMMEGLVIARYGRNEEAARLLGYLAAEVERRPMTRSMMALASGVYNCLGVALSYLGRYAESTPAFRRADEMATRAEDPLQAITCRINQVDDLIWLGLLQEAEVLVEQILTLAPKHGDIYNEAYALETLGSLLVRRREYAKAIAILHQSLATWQECSGEEPRPGVEADLALAHLGLRDLETAHERGRRGVQQAEGRPFALSYALDALAQVQTARSDWELAQSTYEQSIAVAAAAGVKHYAAFAQRHYADLLLQAGDRQRGLDLLTRAHQTFLDMDLAWEISNTEEVMTKWGITVADLPALPEAEQGESDESRAEGAAVIGEESEERSVAGILAWMGWDVEDTDAEEPVQFRSCFISHSSRDGGFAERLHADLMAKGVACWFAPEDLRIGDKIRQRVEDEIQQRQKVLLVLSTNSVASDWVASEVEAALEKERQTGEDVLFPIRLDEAVMETKAAWAAEIRRTRHIGDFTKWENPDAYGKGLTRVLKDLTR